MSSRGGGSNEHQLGANKIRLAVDELCYHGFVEQLESASSVSNISPLRTRSSAHTTQSLSNPYLPLWIAPILLPEFAVNFLSFLHVFRPEHHFYHGRIYAAAALSQQYRAAASYRAVEASPQ